MVENHGYPAETHFITTEDNYILQYHRVPHGLNNNDGTKKPPVLLFHSHSFCSAQEFIQGPEKSLGYMLADSGYDVWMANARGTHYSLNHTYLNPETDFAQFYNFTFHEIGYYDLPAAVDYILNATNYEKIFYIGNSQGSTVFCVFLATRPQYVKKIQLGVLISAAVYVKHDTGLFNKVVPFAPSFWKFAQKYDFWRVNYQTVRESLQQFLKIPAFFEIFIDVLSELISREDADALRPYLLVYVTNVPSGTTVKNYLHFIQGFGTGNCIKYHYNDNAYTHILDEFRQFDYGKAQNLKKYGTETPPDYNLTHISCPTALYYGRNDIIIPFKVQISQMALQ